MSSTRSLPENADLCPAGSYLEIGPEERRRFLNALIRTTLCYHDLDPDENKAKIRYEAQRAGVPVAEVTEAWKERLRDFKKDLLEGWITFRTDDLAEEELNQFRSIVRSPRNRKWALEGADEEDFMMDLLTKLLQDQPDFLLPEYGADATPWFKSVVYNHTRRAVRDMNRHEKILHRAVRDPQSWLSTVRSGESAEAAALRHLAGLEIIRAITRLPKHLGDVAYLRYRGDSYAEIGRALGITENTVNMRLRKIRSPKIRAVLGL